MNDQFQPLDNDEVLFISVGRVLMPNPTFKVGEFLDALAQAVSDREQEWSEDNEGWFSDGLDCEALRFSTQGWQRGRVRIRLEFAPEERTPKLLNMRREERRPEREDRRPPDGGRPETRPDRLDAPRYDDVYGRDDEY
jgi:KGK domain